jgi:hypothetical protein
MLKFFNHVRNKSSSNINTTKIPIFYNVKIQMRKFCYLWNKMDQISGKREKRNKVTNKYDYVVLKFGSEARKILTNGIQEMSETVAKTFGPLGKNVAISELNDPGFVTKDGVTVAKYIKFSNRQKNLGCKLLSSIAGSTNEFAGDGTTTSTILGGEIVK